MSSCFSRCLRVPIAIRAFYESYLWILQTLFLTHPDLHPGLLAVERSGFPRLTSRPVAPGLEAYFLLAHVRNAEKLAHEQEDIVLVASEYIYNSYIFSIC